MSLTLDSPEKTRDGLEDDDRDLPTYTPPPPPPPPPSAHTKPPLPVHYVSDPTKFSSLDENLVRVSDMSMVEESVLNTTTIDANDFSSDTNPVMSHNVSKTNYYVFKL